MNWKLSLFLFVAFLLPVKGMPVCTDPSNQWTGTTGNQRWNNSGNWSVCIPGVLITDQDIANFGPVGSGTISLDAGGGDPAISPGLNVLTFNNLTGFTINSAGTVNHIQFNAAATTPSLQVLAGNHTTNAVMTINNTTLNMTIASGSQLTVQQNLNDVSPGSILFTGPGTIVVAPPVANRGISIGGSLTQQSGSVQLINSNSVATLAGSRISASQGIFIDSGTYLSRNNATINGTGTGALNESTGTSGRLVLTNGSMTLENTGTINASARGSVFSVGDLGVTVDGSSINTINSGPINGTSSMGSQLTTTGSIVVNSSAITQTNTGAANTISAARGCNFLALTDLMLNDVTLTQTNNGTISGNDQVIGCSVSSNRDTVLNGGAVTNINEGTISNGVGVRLFGNANLTINDGTVLSRNSGTTSAATAFGASLSSNNNVNINGGTVNNTNTGTLNGGAGARVFAINTTVNGGVLTLENAGVVNSGSGTIGAQALSTNIQISGGTILLSNSGTVLNSATNSAGTQMRATGNLTMSGGTLTLAANSGAVSGTNNAGSRVEAVGSLTLNGGTLLNDDTVQTPLLTIGTFGNMAGKGSFADINNGQTTQITNSGTVTPGNPGAGASSPGVMSINGNYTQSSSGKLIVNILNPSIFSQLSVLGSTSGTAQLDGNLEVALSPGASFLPGDVFSILTTEQASGVSGTFANVINDVPGLMPHLQYFPNHVDLSFTPFLNNFIGGFSETVLSSVNQINVKLGRQMLRLHDRVVRKRGQGSEIAIERSWSHPFIAANTEDFGYCSPCLPDLPWNLYFGPTGNIGKVSSNGSQPGFNFWSVGAAAGFDYAWDQLGLGFRFDYDHIDGHSGQWGDFRTDEAHGCFYSTYAPCQVPDLVINGIVGGSYEWYRFSRNVGMWPNRLIGTPQGGEFDALLEMEYALSHQVIARMPSCLRVIPLVNLQYIYMKVGSYSEQNGGLFSLAMESQTVQSLRSTLGTRFQSLWMRESGYRLQMEIDFAWQREYLNQSRSVAFTPIAFVQPFSTLIVPASGRNIILAGIDLQTTYQEKYGWEASYDFEWNSNYLDHNFYLGFSVNF